MRSYFIYMYSNVIRMSIVCTHMSSACPSCVLVYNYVSLVCTRMSSVCHLYVIRMALVCTRMSSVCHSYAFVYHPYVTRMYSYVIRMSLICTRMSSLCHSYVLVCHPYFTGIWFYYELFLTLSLMIPIKYVIGHVNCMNE